MLNFNYLLLRNNQKNHQEAQWLTRRLARGNLDIMSDKKQKNMGIHLLAGGVAGCCEALTCHPLDTIKVRLQLRGAAVKRVTPSITTVGSNAVNTAAKEAFKVDDIYLAQATKLYWCGCSNCSKGRCIGTL